MYWTAFRAADLRLAVSSAAGMANCRVSPPLEHFEHQTVEAMKKAGIDPAIIFAYQKTGRLATEENQHLLPETALEEWQAAIDEYEMRHRIPKGTAE